jgi:predicted lysophospholipase L1 biosynthesis ABC-type transport system permease subunit
MWRLAWRMLGRELRSGELRLLFMALVVAVAAVTAVGFFADRVRLALELQAQQLMGSDLVLTPSPLVTRDYAGSGKAWITTGRNTERSQYGHGRSAAATGRHQGG